MATKIYEIESKSGPVLIDAKTRSFIKANSPELFKRIKPVKVPAAPAPIKQQWKNRVFENFTTDVGEGGAFLRAYPNFRAYKGFKDTCKRNTYTGDQYVSVRSGVLQVRLVNTADGLTVASLSPDNYTGQTYGRYTVKFRTDTIRGAKVAIMLWPVHDDWTQGEVDFPEANLGDYTQGYSHNTQGSPQHNAAAFKTSAVTTEWHEYAIEWLPGSLEFFVDGVSVQRTTDAAAIPTNPMRYQLQIEGALDGSTPDARTNGIVYIESLMIDEVAA